MPFSTRQKSLFERLYRERNGAVVETMTRLGVRYAENWGVALPTIRAIARAEATDHTWARALWQHPLREARLAALWIAAPEQMMLEEDFWRLGLDTPELADEWAFVLRRTR